MTFLFLLFLSHVTEVCHIPMTYDCWYFYSIQYNFCNICNAINCKHFFFTNSYRKSSFQTLGSRKWKLNSNTWFPFKKMSENFLISKICNTNPSILHRKCIRVNPPWFPLIIGNSCFFIFKHFEIIELIWGKPHDPSPRHLHCSILKLKMADNGACPQTQSSGMNSQWVLLIDTGGAQINNQPAWGGEGVVQGNLVCLEPPKNHSPPKLMLIFLMHLL